MASHDGATQNKEHLLALGRCGARLNRDVGARHNRQLVVVTSDVEV